MKQPSNEPASPEAVEAAAAEWLALHDRGLSPAEQDAFLQWLAAAPGHRESFQRHQQMWADLNLLAHWRPEHAAEPNPALLARPRQRSKWIPLAPGLLAAAAAVVLVLASRVFTRDEPSQAFAFEAESYQEQTLPDGSIVELNRDTHVVVQYSTAERRVLLVHGEAQFTVAKNIARPFVVRAGGVDVRAVGTTFNVKLAGTSIEVLVTEGAVRVAQKPVSEPARSPAGAELPPAVAEVSAGHRTIVPVTPVATPIPVMPATPEEIDRLLEWRPRLLDFNATLADVVAEFNRRNTRQLLIGETELQALPIVASVRSDNVDGFVRVLEATFGVQAEQTASGDVVLRRKR